MTKTTYTARTKSQLVAALARKGFTRDAIREAADNAVRFGNWDVVNFNAAGEAQNASVVITFGDTEVDLWDAQLMTEEEHEAWTVAQHAARKVAARKRARSIDHVPAGGETIDGLGVVTWVSGRNCYDFGDDFVVINYRNRFGSIGTMEYIVTEPATDTTPCPAGTRAQHDAHIRATLEYVAANDPDPECAVPATVGELIELIAQSKSLLENLLAVGWGLHGRGAAHGAHGADVTGEEAPGNSLGVESSITRSPACRSTLLPFMMSTPLPPRPAPWWRAGAARAGSPAAPASAGTPQT